MSDKNVSGSLGQLQRISVEAQVGQEVLITCPACGCVFPYRVLRTGNAIISCRDCKSPLLLRIQPKSIPQEQPVPKPAAKPEKNSSQPAIQNASLLGVAHLGSDGNYVVDNHAMPGVPVRIKCGKCGKMHMLNPSSAGRKSISCVACGTSIVFTVDDPSAVSHVKVATAKAPKEPQVTVALRDRDKQHAMGAITFGGFMGIKRKAIRLRVGQNTIGRIDAEKPSSISFNDSFMSRQSAMIDVMPADDIRAGYRFLFRVLNAANPVYVNKQQYAVGDSVYLNYGDIIRLGRTTVRFVKVK